MLVVGTSFELHLRLELGCAQAGPSQTSTGIGEVKEPGNEARTGARAHAMAMTEKGGEEGAVAERMQRQQSG